MPAGPCTGALWRRLPTGLPSMAQPPRHKSPVSVPGHKVALGCSRRSAQPLRDYPRKVLLRKVQGRSLHSDPWREGHRAPFLRSRLMRVSPCSVVSCLLLYVSLCVGVLRRVPLHIRVSPETRQRLHSLRIQRHLNLCFWLRALTDEALEEQKTTDGLEAERGQARSMLTSRYLRSVARAAYHLARRSRRKSLRGRTIAGYVRQRPEWSNGFLFN